MEYENMLMEYGNNLIIKEKPLRAYDGRIKGNKILIRKDMDSKKKSCVLAEEIGHYYTTVGNILDQSNSNNRKQELRAREWAYNNIVGLDGIIKAYKNGCQNSYEISEFLEVTEEFLKETLDRYKSKYGIYIKKGDYIIIFEPYLRVIYLYNLQND